MHQAAHLFQTALLPGEYWWGGAVQEGVNMPYRCASYQFDLRAHFSGNQANPLLLSSKGRYIWSDHPFALTFDGRELRIETDADVVVYAEGFGRLAGAYRAACARFFPPSGRMPDPLNFIAPQYNTWIEMKYEPTQEKVLHYARSILDHDLPPGVLMIDDNWFEDYGGWDFHARRFPDPKEMIRQLHAWGFKVMLWVCPFVSPDSQAFRRLAAANCLVRTAPNEPALRRWWNGYSALLDLTYSPALEWLHARLDHLVREFGVDGFKFDAGDPEFYRSTDLTHTPGGPEEQCEAWGRVGLRYNLSEYRACWKLAGQPLIQRLRDKLHTWGAGGLADLIPNGLAQSLAGYAFTCPDMIGGGDIASFSGDGFAPDQELFVRTAQCAALFPIMQFSTAPWRVLEDEPLRCCLAMVALRRQLGSTFLALARHSAQTGEPMMRHPAYVFPEEGLEEVGDQFMLGSDILVAPVLQQGAETRTVIFPSGRWIDDEGGCIQGPAISEVEAPLSRLPWFRRTA